jgi:hypothetical protein
MSEQNKFICCYQLQNNFVIFAICCLKWLPAPSMYNPAHFTTELVASCIPLYCSVCKQYHPCFTAGSLLVCSLLINHHLYTFPEEKWRGRDMINGKVSPVILHDQSKISIAEIQVFCCWPRWGGVPSCCSHMFDLALKGNGRDGGRCGGLV